MLLLVSVQGFGSCQSTSNGTSTQTWPALPFSSRCGRTWGSSGHGERPTRSGRRGGDTGPFGARTRSGGRLGTARPPAQRCSRCTRSVPWTPGPRSTCSSCRRTCSQVLVPNAAHHGLDGVADAHPFGRRARSELVRRRKLLLPGARFRRGALLLQAVCSQRFPGGEGPPEVVPLPILLRAALPTTMSVSACGTCPWADKAWGHKVWVWDVVGH